MSTDIDILALRNNDNFIVTDERELPCKNFHALQIWYNFNITVLSAGTFSDVTFEEIGLWVGALETVEDDTFSSMADTVQMLSFDIQKLDDTFPFHIIETMSNLVVLDLTANKIHTFPENLSSSSLEVLVLGENRLQKLPEKPFNLLPKLNAVDLGDTQLRVLPKDLFINNPNIQSVMLRGNNLSNLTKDTFSFSSNKMEWLQLRWNNVGLVEEGTFDGLIYIVLFFF
ncbi:unnamed protein product, partial [Meganyctiphanes norvegica]